MWRPHGIFYLMAYKVKEIFYTVQGEGSQSGSPSVFLRLSACNLWAGTEETRSKGKSECAMWCDTDFVGGDKLNVPQIMCRISTLWNDGEVESSSAPNEWVETPSMPFRSIQPLVIITGGEPALQLKRDPSLIESMLDVGWRVSIETNGTIECEAVDKLIVSKNGHVTVSPKRLLKPGLDHITLRRGTDLKVIVPQFMDDEIDQMKSWDFDNFFIQPLDSGDNGLLAITESIREAHRLGWRISIQTHKTMGLP